MGSVLRGALFCAALTACGSNDGNSDGDAPPASASPSGGGDTGGSDTDGSASKLSAGMNVWKFTENIDGEDVERRVLVVAPPALAAGESYPVLFAFHGTGGSGYSYGAQFDALLKKEGFIGVYPTGHAPEGERNSWNLGPEKSNADDMELVRRIVAELSRHPEVNTDRMFAAGSSNGGGMALKLGIETTYFKGLASLSTGLHEGQGPLASTPVTSVLQVNGSRDNLIPFDGGMGVLDNVFQPALESAGAWATHGGCMTGPTDTVTTGGNDRWEWSDCAEGARVELYRMNGYGHGGYEQEEGGVAALVWNFFASLP